MILAGALPLGGSTLAFQAGLLAPLAWMIVTGAGLYRADAGSVALLLMRSLGAPTMQWLPFFATCSYATALAVALFTLISALHFLRYRPSGATHVPA